MVNIQSPTAEIRRGKKERKKERKKKQDAIIMAALLHRATITECGPIPNVMVALPNIGAVVAPCCNAAKSRNPLKFAGVPKTGKPISAVCGPKLVIL